MGKSILIALDDPAVTEALSIFLQSHGLTCTSVPDGPAAFRLLRHATFDLVLCDAELDGMSGYEIAERIRDEYPQTAVLLVGSEPGPEEKLLARRSGVRDTVSRPIRHDDLLLRLRRALSLDESPDPPGPIPGGGSVAQELEPLIGKSAAMQGVLEMIRKLSASASTVLITGESGTGKEVVARKLHDACEGTRDQRFVPINCAAIPATLLESELFGHVRGAFTGATSEKKGLFEMAQRGSLFLDEIGELDLGLQAKLLRAIDRKEFVPVGGVHTVRLDARVLCATNCNLEELIARKLFREDLFYRISVVELRLPPLRERREDIPALVAHFLRKLNGELQRDVRGVDPRALEALQGHEWRGNVRELQNVIERAMILGQGPTISIEDLPAHIGRRPSRQTPRLREALREFERQHLQLVLEKSEGDPVLAARQLGIGVSSLYRKLRKLHLIVPKPQKVPDKAGLDPRTRDRLRKEVVICVDDDRQTLSSLQRLLRNAPYRVLFTQRPSEALEWVGANEVSLLLSDQRMPTMTGTRLLQEVSTRSPATARLLLTAYPDCKDVVEAMGRTVQGVISKPWNGTSLKRTILAHLVSRDRKHRAPDDGTKN